MLIGTKCFGEVNIQDEKIVYFPDGILGFEELKNYTIIYDTSRGQKAKIAWLQSTDEPGLALPVISPVDCMEGYDPVVDDALLNVLGNVTPENVVILLVVTVPEDVTKTTANQKAPIIINSDTRLGAQIIVENKDYVIKYPIVGQKKGESSC